MTDLTHVPPSRLSDYVDRALDARDESAVRDHLATCPACRGVVQDLERMRASARALGPMAPPDHLWMQIAGRIRLENAKPGSDVTGARPRPSFVPWLGLTAALVLVTLGVYFVTTLSQQVPPAASAVAESNAPSADPVETAVAELQKAATHYENAMLELDRLAQANEGAIEPSLAKLLRDQLDMADRAITESRQAMQSDPTSQPARESLFEAFRRKVSVLQATVSLMNEMRQGNPEGASKAAAGLNNKKG
jgi:anti-sigma factor RsiW